MVDSAERGREARTQSKDVLLGHHGVGHGIGYSLQLEQSFCHDGSLREYADMVA